jgi:RNA polymerase sigma-70 factor (ECF subfamily)
MKDGATIVTHDTPRNADERDDLALLSAWQHGDARAGRRFYGRFGSRIRQYFRRRVDATQDVADLVQETFLRCQQTKFRGEGAISAFLLGIAYRVFMEFLRGRTRHTNRSSDDELLEQPVAAIFADPEYVLAQAQETRHLMKALRRIPLRYQLVLEMSRWEDLTQAEMAAILGRPAPTIGRWKSEAMEALEAMMTALASSPELREATTMTVADWRRWLHEHASDVRPPKGSNARSSDDAQ